VPKTGILGLAWSRIKGRIRSNVLGLERRLVFDKSDTGGGFFDAYPMFYSTSTSGKRNRLNKRYRAIIEANESIIQNKSILDIASHDGRWSLAAHFAGARYVLGIEAREQLVNQSRATMSRYGIPDGRVDFVLGDVFEELDRLEPGRFDTVFCLGFFYHTLHHMLLLHKIARLKPTNLIIDTCVDLDPDSTIVIQKEEVENETAGAVPDPGNRTHILVGTPTRSALESMLSMSGFSVKYFNWHGAGIKRWDDLVEYHKGLRVTTVATCIDSKLLPG
jgi:hypothetical protein